MADKELCNGDCIPGNSYTPEEKESITINYPGGSLTGKESISFTIEAENEGGSGGYKHTWKLTGDEDFQLDLVMLPDTDYGPTIFGYLQAFTTATASNSLGQSVNLNIPARYSVSQVADINGNTVEYANFNNGASLVKPSGTFINITLNASATGNCEGEREWISTEPVESYTINEATYAEAYLIEGDLYPTTNPPLSYVIEDDAFVISDSTGVIYTVPNLQLLVGLKIINNGVVSTYRYNSVPITYRFVVGDLGTHSYEITQANGVVSTVFPPDTQVGSETMLPKVAYGMDYYRSLISIRYDLANGSIRNESITIYDTATPNGIQYETGGVRIRFGNNTRHTYLFTGSDSDLNSVFSRTATGGYDLLSTTSTTLPMVIDQETGIEVWVAERTQDSGVVVQVLVFDIRQEVDGQTIFAYVMNNTSSTNYSGSNYLDTSVSDININSQIQNILRSHVRLDSIGALEPNVTLRPVPPELWSTTGKQWFYSGNFDSQRWLGGGGSPSRAFKRTVPITKVKLDSGRTYYLWTTDGSAPTYSFERIPEGDPEGDIVMSWVRNGTSIARNYNYRSIFEASIRYFNYTYTTEEIREGDNPVPQLLTGENRLTFFPQEQSFTFDYGCVPYDVIINQQDVASYTLTIFKDGAVAVTEEYETNPLSLISILSGLRRYILTIMGKDLEGKTFEQQYTFDGFDPTSIPSAFNITQLPYSEIIINEGECQANIKSPTYGEFSCTTTDPYALPVSSGPVNAIKLFDTSAEEWLVKFFDGLGNVLQTNAFKQEPIIQGNEFLGNNFVLATDPITGMEYVIPNPDIVGGIDANGSILPGMGLVVDGKEYTVSGIRLQINNPEAINADAITSFFESNGISLDFNFEDFTTGDVAFDLFNNWGSVTNSTTPTTTFTLQGLVDQRQLEITIPPFDPNFNFNTLSDQVTNNIQPTSPNNRPVINLNKQQPIVQCDCPDATKTRRYISSGKEEGLTVSWENSSAGAKEILGVKGCKHAYSVLIANGLEQPYKPVDAQPDIVPNQYGIQPPIIGDDVSDYFDDNIGIPKEGFNMPRNKGRQRFL